LTPLRLLRDRVAIAPTSDENETAAQTIEATSPFESRPVDRIRWRHLDLHVARRLIGVAEQRQPETLSDEDLLAGASLRGLVWHDLSYFYRIEERGSGFRRMRDQMLDHGLDQPLLGTDTGYFQVTFPGPGDNIDRLRVPEKQLLITPAVEAQLSDRQQRVLRHVLEAGSVTRRWCVAEFHVANDTAGRDLKSLTDMGLLIPEGRARAVRYVLGTPPESTDNRPTIRWNRPIGNSLRCLCPGRSKIGNM